MAEEIQRILSGLFLTRINIPAAGLLTITRVDVSRDLRNARIYLSMLNPVSSKETALRDIRRRAKQIRFLLGAQLQTRYVPTVRFLVDDALERSARIDELLDRIHQSGSEDGP